MDNIKNTIHFENMAKVIRNNRLKPVDKALLLDLLLYAGVNGESFPSQETLAKNMGCSTRYIRYRLDMLCAARLVIRKRRGFGKSNIYIFNKELYFPNGTSNRKPSSSHSGNRFPYKSGTSVPANETQLNKSSNALKKNNKKKSSINDISEVDIREIAEHYKVPIGLVQLQLEALKNYCSSTGKEYKDYKAALKNFVLREAKSNVERRSLHGDKRGIDASGI